MTTTQVRAAALPIVLLAFAVAFLWQQARISRLGVEATDLRVQLGQAAAAREGENRQLANFQPSMDQPLTQEQFRELLRLRGEVGVLRGQLADALRLTGKEENLATSEKAQRRQRSALAVLNLDAALTAQQGKVAEGKQKVEELLRALSVPEDVARMDGNAVANLSTESMENFMPYFQAKREFEELERFTAILKMKMSAERIEAQEDVPKSSSP
jgi:hypothetical protein